MKNILLALIFIISFKSYSQDEVKNKVIKLLELSTSIDDLKLLENFKLDYPDVFEFYPDINPINPLNSPKVSSKFSKKRLHPIYGTVKNHNGVDIVANINTPVYATADGKIKKSAFFNGAAGHSVDIEHKYGFRTKYFHLSIFIVETGEDVKKGQIIGFLGSSGSSTAPHLHYEILKNNSYIDSGKFLGFY